jgi:hypothetical protein
MVMRQLQKKLSDVNWLNWAELVERVRTAKNPEVAIARLQKDIDLAWTAYSITNAEDTLRNYKATKHANEVLRRATAMANAMAYKEGEEGGDFIELAARIDAALIARKKFEL